MVLRRLFGAPGLNAAPADASELRGSTDAETAALRRIVAQLDALPAEQRRYVAGFAYVLSRVANADLDISPGEVALMERTVMDVAGLPEAQAVLVVQIARHHAELYGGTDDYVLTREFGQFATPEQRESLLRCCFTIAAADRTINAQESAELDELGRELGFADQEVRQLRAEFKDQLGAVQELRRVTERGPDRGPDR
ncbi:MAG: hypothetical protein QOH61_232 [Chloroflexota bacterium]|jgi:uncharacterized tellurite resistance protein B-like protein|nr:hypothetical protein [Chloroflexota bacterium]